MNSSLIHPTASSAALFSSHNATQTLLQHWFQAGQIRAIDKQFGWFLQDLQDSQESQVLQRSHEVSHSKNTDDADAIDWGAIDWVAIVGVLVSQQLAQQHACIALNEVPLRIAHMNANVLFHARRQRQSTPNLPPDSLIPSAAQLLVLLQHELRVCSVELTANAGNSANVSSVLDRPLILEHVIQPNDARHSRLFLHKYWCYETRLVQRLCHFAQQRIDDVDFTAIATDLSRLFPTSENDAGSDSQYSEINWQKVAVALAAQQKLTVITGGPGTGKTTTVAKLLWLLAKKEPSGEEDVFSAEESVFSAEEDVFSAEENVFSVEESVPSANVRKKEPSKHTAQPNSNELVIKLAAPTGKAAARLSESLRIAAGKLPATDNVLALPSDCTTIHRLLGVKKLSPFFVHHRDNPLSLDILVVDEASMIDLPLLCKLFEALPDHAQVILLGDNNQLASVEVGSVLGDVCVDRLGQNLGAIFSPTVTQRLQQLTAEPLDDSHIQACEQDPAANQRAISQLTDNNVHLQKSYRFHAHSGIGYLARAVNAGHVVHTMQLLKQQSHPENFASTVQAESATSFDDIAWYGQLQFETLHSVIHAHWQAYFVAAHRADVKQVFHLLTQLQILCTQRQGEWGVEGLNTELERYFSRQGWVEQRTGFYVGKPIMIVENDHRLGLYNGDIGVVLAASPLEANAQQSSTMSVSQPDPAASLMRVWFPANASTQRDSGGELAAPGFQYFLTGQLPRHETVYAMTTHKSQGSEFAHVVLCMPEPHSEQQKYLLNRELFYTGITRAKSKISVFAQAGAVSHAVSQQCTRASGLMERLILNA